MDFFDQETGNENEVQETGSRPEGASILINGSYQNVEVGAPFLATVKNAALNAHFGKFKVFLNGTEVRPSNAPASIETDMNIEVRPYDEAG